MIGAIIGDVVGSGFETNNINSKTCKLINKYSSFTDDSVLTIAVMDWLLHSKEKNSKTATHYLQKWGRRYPYAGYGGKFNHWINSTDPKPYNSCGNGSAMRISGVGWASEDSDELKKLSDIVTGVSHNHPEGLKGAFVTSELIFMARRGASKEEMRKFAEQYYDLNLNVDTLKANSWSESPICQTTVPKAIYCFLISNSFEDCLRITVSLGGDLDTTAAISCSIAEAYYNYIPDELIDEVESKLTPAMIEIVEQFREEYGGQ